MKLFISHSRDDKAWVHELWRALCTRAADVPPDTERQSDLWDMLDDLLDNESTHIRFDDARWWASWLAALITAEQDIFTGSKLRDKDQEACEQLRAATLKLIETPHTLLPAERAQCGRVLSLLGDPRPGAGVKSGHPDILWSETIPSGQFLYGEDKEERHIERSYAISKYPVTYAQYEPFVTGDGYNNPLYWTRAGTALAWNGNRTRPTYWQDMKWHLANHPVIGVTWYEAFAYGNWLTAQQYPEVWEAYLRHCDGNPAEMAWPDYEDFTGLVRLPTELEWERAARGTDGRIYPWGAEWDATKCNNGVLPPAIGRTSAVGIFPLGDSPCGASDIAGNVLEWCLTKYATSECGVDGRDVRSLRGGSWWHNNPAKLQVAYRYFDFPDFIDDNFGFRCVRSV